MKGKASIAAYSLVLGIYTVAAYHLPFFRHVLEYLGEGDSKVAVVAFLALMLTAMNFVLYYLLVYFGRTVGKFLIAITLLFNAAAVYLVVSFNQMASIEMMGSVFHSNYNEVSGFFSFPLFFNTFLLGVPPVVYLFARKVERGSLRTLFACAGIALVVGSGAAAANYSHMPVARRHAPQLCGLIFPWSYIINTARFLDSERIRHRDEIMLPDAKLTTDTEDVCVLIIGESVRRDHLSHYGYGRETCPYTSRDSVTALAAMASATYTIGSVKALLEPEETDDLYEILPNYLYRTGIDVEWRTSNWGEPPVKTEKYYDVKALKQMYPDADAGYDGILLAGLREAILSSDKPKQFIVLHSYTNHGPMYCRDYPPEFEVFKPTGKIVEDYKSDPQLLYNAYDNSLVYTDWLIHSVIEILQGMPDKRTCMLFVSDHGESLGENNTYMHATPLEFAPKEQLEIPFLVWTRNAGLKVKDLPEVGQHHVYHSVLRFFGVDSPAFNESLCIFE